MGRRNVNTERATLRPPGRGLDIGRLKPGLAASEEIDSLMKDFNALDARLEALARCSPEIEDYERVAYLMDRQDGIVELVKHLPLNSDDDIVAAISFWEIAERRVDDDADSRLSTHILSAVRESLLGRTRKA